MDDKADRFLKRFEKAKRARDLSQRVIDECYEFAVPLRDRPYASKGGDGPDLDRLFDSTAPALAQDLASEMLDDVWPTDAPPFELRAGNDIPEELRDELDRKLVDVTADITETINNSNFRDAAHKALIDWEIGTGIMLPESGDFLDPVVFRHLPLPDAMLTKGPRGTTDALYVERIVSAGMVKEAWPQATLPDELQKLANNPDEADKDHKFIEGVERDYPTGPDAWKFSVLWCGAGGNTGKGKKEFVVERTMKGAGAKPFVDFSYMHVANEPIGRGVLQLALPDIKSLNLLKQYALEAGDMALGGVWQYDDDGVINPDTIQIAPRTLIPRSPGSDGLSRVDGATDYNVAEYLIAALTQSIRHVMLGEDLGSPEGTPMSATEVMARTANRAKRRAGPYTQLLRGLLFQTVQRVAYIRREQGAIGPLRIDGRNITLRPLSPLTRAQAQDEIVRHARFIELGNQLHGPQQMALSVKASESIQWLADKMGENPRNLNSKIERAQLEQAIAQLAVQAQGGDVAA